MIKVKVSARGLHSSMRKILREEVTRIGKDVLEEVAEKAAEYAQDQYDKALYAGESVEGKINVWVEEDGPLSLSLNPEGPRELVKFIEYGTGVYNKSGYTNPKTGKPYWWFNENGRDIVENDLVEQAKPRIVKGYWDDVYDEEGNLTGDKVYEEYSSPVMKEREGVYFTAGSPANNIMTKTREQILNKILPEVVKAHGGKHLT